MEEILGQFAGKRFYREVSLTDWKLVISSLWRFDDWLLSSRVL